MAEEYIDVGGGEGLFSPEGSRWFHYSIKKGKSQTRYRVGLGTKWVLKGDYKIKWIAN